MRSLLADRFEALQEDAAARIDTPLGKAVTSALSKPLFPSKLGQSVPRQGPRDRRCQSKIPVKIEHLMVAPNGNRIGSDVVSLGRRWSEGRIKIRVSSTRLTFC